MPATITAKEQNLVKVFSDEYFFEIPLYQRPYAWTTEEVSDLLDDITNARERDSENPYFLGSVVLIKNEGESRSQVVDGQQRLTTLTMLICILRDISGDEDLDSFIREAGNRRRGTEDRYRLSLRELDREFFENHVQNRGRVEDFLKIDPVKFSDSQNRILENVRYLYQELTKLNDSQRDGLADYVSTNCYLVVVSASDVESAYRIFSVMNDRGLPLSPTDILKANIIGKMLPSSQDEYTRLWENIEVELGRDDFRDLFAHIRTIYRKDKLRGTLQREFQDHVLGDLNAEKDDKEAANEAVKFLNDVLDPYATVYETVSRAAYESTEGAEKVNAHLRYLKRLDNFDWIPPAMAYFRSKGGQRDKLIEFTRGLERLAYGLFIQRANSTDRIRRYGEVLTAIETESDLFGENSPLQLRPNEKADVLRILDGNIYELSRVPMPLLQRLDNLLADAGEGYAPRAISIEHVLPQKPVGKWIEWFPDADERAQWTHRLANLVLLSRRKNSQASNYDFDKKKSEYFQKKGTTTFALTTQVVSEVEWTPKVLKRRQSELVDALKKEWRLS